MGYRMDVVLVGMETALSFTLPSELSSDQVHCQWTAFFFFFFCLFRTTSTAFGSSQDRGRIGTATATATATQDLSHVCDVYPSSQQHQILNPWSRTRDWTHILMATSQVHFCWATMGTPSYVNFCSSKSTRYWRSWWNRKKNVRVRTWAA